MTINNTATDLALSLMLRAQAAEAPLMEAPQKIQRQRLTVVRGSGSRTSSQGASTAPKAVPNYFTTAAIPPMVEHIHT